MSSNTSEVVVVTGFGPFRKYLINPSWQAAQGLKATGLGEGVEVYIKELPVSYVKAQQLISHIWETVSPKLAVHLGIDPGTKAVRLEQRGKNQGYRDRDVCGFCPEGNCCVAGGPDKVDSIIDMKSLTRLLNSSGLDVMYSRDAGRYLCDFVYYHSLLLGQGRAIFIHVPASGKLAAPERLVPLLRAVIMAMLHQLEVSSSPESDQLQLQAGQSVR
ncbi:pyroglutamyl-peptidase 1 [Megalops cyprinoides]|uniref:pyroglutamyl-peptidase 1 n=1 Tax=Megalops cyprinoides TaxID=118141 RepID=UPI0018643F16|nr:pyroglutamyl-peptidase 1 [Megalops cyprinoides]